MGGLSFRRMSGFKGIHLLPGIRVTPVPEVHWISSQRLRKSRSNIAQGHVLRPVAKNDMMSCTIPLALLRQEWQRIFTSHSARGVSVFLYPH